MQRHQENQTAEQNAEALQFRKAAPLHRFRNRLRHLAQPGPETRFRDGAPDRLPGMGEEITEVCHAGKPGMAA